MSAEVQKKTRDLLVNYAAPEWVQKLDKVPKSRIQLVHANTPIHRWYVPGVPDGFELYVKRDDMTGSQLSGNKVRKLEFLLADAVCQGCSTIITCGGIHSNHCRATAIAAKQLGFEVHLLLKCKDLDPKTTSCQGNVLLDRLVGSHIHLIPIDSSYNGDVQQRLDNFVKMAREKRGEKVYAIPCGGSNSVGLFGYVAGFQELVEQRVAERFSDVAVAVGSGATVGAIAMSNYLTDSKLKIHGLIVGGPAEYFHTAIDKMLDGVGWRDIHPDLRSQDLCALDEGAGGVGYAKSTPEELEFISEVATATGIILDPVYTGKALLRLIKMMNESPEAFKGKKVLFIHTGGIFGIFGGCMDTVITRSGAATDRIDAWNDVDKVPGF